MKLVTMLPSFTICRFVLLFTCIASCLYGQTIDNTSSVRMLEGDRYIRFYFDNDLFTGADRYYTQGVALDFVCPVFVKNPLSHLLLAPKQNENFYGLGLEHSGFTPIDIGSLEIQYGDRPYASYLILRSFAYSNNAAKRQRITSSLSMGVIGPASGAEAVQTFVHKITGSVVPDGWHNQISNDFLINYEAGIEKNFFHSPFLIFNGLANGRLGIINTKFSAGATLMIGRFNQKIASVFSGASGKSHKFNFHIYAQPSVNAVLYDATLQGGIFNSNSPYTLSYSEIKPFTWTAYFGLVVTYKFAYIEYVQAGVSPEIDNSNTHWWGGIRIGGKF